MTAAFHEDLRTFTFVYWYYRDCLSYQGRRCSCAWMPVLPWLPRVPLRYVSVVTRTRRKCSALWAFSILLCVCVRARLFSRARMWKYCKYWICFRSDVVNNIHNGFLSEIWFLHCTVRDHFLLECRTSYVQTSNNFQSLSWNTERN